MKDKPISAQTLELHRIHEDWGNLLWLASKDIGNADGLTLGRVVIKPGQSNPRHCHPACEEIIYVLSGRLEHTLGDQSYTMGTGDVLPIPAGVFHNATNIGDEDVDVIVAYSDGERGFVLE
ncbi:MAG: cupin domain-containing protein [Chloroflexota bacterium]